MNRTERRLNRKAPWEMQEPLPPYAQAMATGIGKAVGWLVWLLLFAMACAAVVAAGVAALRIFGAWR